jgi:urocanate hydratase
MADITISHEAIADLAAQKLADEIAGEFSISEHVNTEINRRIEVAFGKLIPKKIDEAISGALEKAMSQSINPVDIWGDPVGEATSIREQLGQRAKKFWETMVDHEGKPAKSESYYGMSRAVSRAEWMLGKIVAEEFATQVRQNAINILGAFKDKLSENAKAAIDKHLDELIRVKTR